MRDSKVFGIGWAKTGTTTLGTCLEMLGYSHQGQALDLVHDVQSGDFSRIFAVADRFDAFEDWPWILIYRELDRRYPGSRFILTVRDTDRWWRSYRNMAATRPGRRDIRQIRRIIYGSPDGLRHKEAYIARYERHNAEVRSYFADRPGDLLIVDWEKGDGWPALCRLLGEPEPDAPFPHANAGRYRPARRPLRDLLRGMWAPGARDRLRGA